jgi:hypothetical protein
LKGAKKGEATSVAIILLPSGNFAMSGVAIKLYIWFANGSNIIVIRIIDIMQRRAVVRNSKRCLINGCSEWPFIIYE